MSDAHAFEMVRSALALHLRIPPAEVRLDQSLDDLGLDPLDLVLIALRLEELAGYEFPVGELTHVRTVSDLAGTVERWTATHVAPRRAPKESGLIRLDAPFVRLSSSN